MLEYQIKFSACLLVFYLFYKILLEKESFHCFKRFYLLNSLLFAAIIPVIGIPLNSNEQLTQIIKFSIINEGGLIPTRPLHVESDLIFILIIIIYLSGVIVLAFRFVYHLLQLLFIIYRNPRIKGAKSIYVLLKRSVTPHTFMRYILLNQSHYNKNLIPEEVIKHEETHAHQYHSVDILLIEIFTIVFWFNPIIYFLRKSMALNHEFLADSAVLKLGIPPKKYWNTLLSYSAGDFQPAMAHAFNYSSVKKRLLIMKKKTGKRSALFRQLAILPLLCLVLFSFSKPAVQFSPRPVDKLGKQEASVFKTEIPLKISTPVLQTITDTPGSSKDPGNSTPEQQTSESEPENRPGKNKGPSPRQFVNEMIEQDAQFYYNDKPINQDRAVLLLQYALKIDLVAMHTGLEKPVVRLSNAEAAKEHQHILQNIYDSP